MSMFLPRAIDYLIKPQKQALEALVWVIGQVVQENPKTL